MFYNTHNIAFKLREEISDVANIAIIIHHGNKS